MITQDTVKRVLKAKMDHNAGVISENSSKIRVALDKLDDSIKRGHLDDMNEALRDIVDNAVGCRGRLQFMRGCWALGADMKALLRMDPTPEPA